jgi:hypothetical protein
VPPPQFDAGLASLLQHLAKHNAFHRAVKNAAKDIVDRCLIAESRAGIIIAALAEFPSCLFDFDTPWRPRGFVPVSALSPRRRGRSIA